MSIKDLRELSVSELENKILDLKKELMDARFSLATSQNEYGKSDDDARIVLNTFIPDNILEKTPSARKLFITKLSQIASRNGLGGSESNTNNRFIISGDLNILTKDVILDRKRWQD